MGESLASPYPAALADNAQEVRQAAVNIGTHW